MSKCSVTTGTADNEDNSITGHKRRSVQSLTGDWGGGYPNLKGSH